MSGVEPCGGCELAELVGKLGGAEIGLRGWTAGAKWPLVSIGVGAAEGFVA